MPLCQYIHNGKDQSRNMLTPKRITSLQHWFKEARKAIPDIPDATPGLFIDSDWMICYSEADIKWIKFDLEHKDGRKGYIVILR